MVNVAVLSWHRRATCFMAEALPMLQLEVSAFPIRWQLSRTACVLVHGRDTAAVCGVSVCPAASSSERSLCATPNMHGMANDSVTCPAAQVSVSVAELEAIHERDSAAHAQVPRMSRHPHHPLWQHRIMPGAVRIVAGAVLCRCPPQQPVAAAHACRRRDFGGTGVDLLLR